MGNTSSQKSRHPRLVSLDAYRGFVMLAMASAGLGIASAVNKYPEILTQLKSTNLDGAWQRMWHTLAYQFSHVPWSGCSFWDLIQPSFMFMVGVAMPFSYAARSARGDSWLKMFAHAAWRSAVLIGLAVFLSSNWSQQTNFVFTNVLAQIGLGYLVVFLLVGRSTVVHLLALIVITGGYWYFFAQYETPPQEQQLVTEYLTEVEGQEPAEWSQFEGFAAHWNKHLNAAAAVDRQFLNWFPRSGEAWHGRKFWINNGGYATLNFIPSIITMILGLMAGQMLYGSKASMENVRNLIGAGLVCFVIVLAVDTTIWPFQIDGWNWTLCPAVKRIWTPTWAIFSAGWTFWMLAAFYWIIDVQGWKRWSLPLVVVGMNSIAMYVMAQLLKPWISKTLEIHANAVSAVAGFDIWNRTVENNIYGPIWEAVLRVAVLWLICAWLYRRKIFIRV